MANNKNQQIEELIAQANGDSNFLSPPKTPAEKDQYAENCIKAIDFQLQAYADGQVTRAELLVDILDYTTGALRHTVE